MSKDYYAVLNVSRNASQEDIKRAYRKLAIKCHPDKNPDNREEATKKFKEVGEAYDTLSDPEKRQMYNVYGAEGVKNQGQRQPQYHGDIDPFDIFEQFLNGGGRRGHPGFHFSSGNFGGRGVHFDMPFGGMGGPFGGGGMGSPFHGGFHGHGPSRELQLPVTLEELYAGLDKTVNTGRQSVTIPLKGKRYDELYQIDNMHIRLVPKTSHSSAYSVRGDSLYLSIDLSLTEFLFTGRPNCVMPHHPGQMRIKENIPPLSFSTISKERMGLPRADGTRGTLEIQARPGIVIQFFKVTGALILLSFVLQNPSERLMLLVLLWRFVPQLQRSLGL